MPHTAGIIHFTESNRARLTYHNTDPRSYEIGPAVFVEPLVRRSQAGIYLGPTCRSAHPRAYGSSVIDDRRAWLPPAWQ